MTESIAPAAAAAPLGGNAAQSAAALIRAAILDGRLAPGQRLKEGSLAQDLRTSRTPVREALNLLTVEGLVQSAPNRGATVCSYSAEDLLEIASLRALLEGRAARLAARVAGAPQLARLRESCERFARLRDAQAPVPELVKENLTFHEAILAAAGSPRLAAMARRVRELPLVYQTYSWFSPERCRSAEHQHLELLNALERRDDERAELVMKHHILAGADLLLEHLGAAA
ncbi:MAG: Transcriptional regulator [Conexibacter sp.]|nr:Transcriptional regulator [Conexibacter sp.]